MANQAAYSVQMMCRLLSVSTSGFYAWEDRPASPRSRYDLYLTGKIHAIHRRSNGAYGSPMIHAELSDDHGIRVGCKRVARLMRAAHLQGVWPHRFVITTVRDDAAKQPIDLVDRRFYAEYPDRLWVADRHHVRSHMGGIFVLSRSVRCVLTQSGWLADGKSFTHGACTRSIAKIPSLNADRKA